MAPVADAGRRPPSKFEVRRPRHSENMADDVVSINGPGDLDLLTLKLVCESHQRWTTFVTNLGTLGLQVQQLFVMYATDGWTDGRTKATLNAPFLRV